MRLLNYEIAWKDMIRGTSVDVSATDSRDGRLNIYCAFEKILTNSYKNTDLDDFDGMGLIFFQTSTSKLFLAETVIYL